MESANQSWFGGLPLIFRFSRLCRLTLPRGREPSSSSTGFDYPVHALIFPSKLSVKLILASFHLVELYIITKSINAVIEQQPSSKHTLFHLSYTWGPLIWSATGLFTILILLLVFKTEIGKFLYRPSLDDFGNVTFTNNYHLILLDNGQSWKVTYEENKVTEFRGMIRYISRINEDQFAILSHDILIASGEFSDPALVTTRVNNHHFNWKSRAREKPSGTINLLHTLPINQQIFLDLNKIKDNDHVIFKGYEIYRIEGWDSQKNPIGYWQDTGCNKLLVIEVVIE